MPSPCSGNSPLSFPVLRCLYFPCRLPTHYISRASVLPSHCPSPPTSIKRYFPALLPWTTQAKVRHPPSIVAWNSSRCFALRRTCIKMINQSPLPHSYESPRPVSLYTRSPPLGPRRHIPGLRRLASHVLVCDQGEPGGLTTLFANYTPDEILREYYCCCLCYCCCCYHCTNDMLIGFSPYCAILPTAVFQLP